MRWFAHGKRFGVNMGSSVLGNAKCVNPEALCAGDIGRSRTMHCGYYCHAENPTRAWEAAISANGLDRTAPALPTFSPRYRGLRRAAYAQHAPTTNAPKAASGSASTRNTAPVPIDTHATNDDFLRIASAR